MKKLALLVVAVATATAFAEVAGLKIGRRGELEWKVPGNLPPGAEYHLVYEDPVTHGVETLVRFPSGYSTEPHAHTHDETMVVLKGKLILDAEGRSTTLRAGDYAVVPAGMAHSFKTAGWSGCETLMTISGPYDVVPAKPSH